MDNLPSLTQSLRDRPVNEKESAIGKILLYEYNQLLQFPLNDFQLTQWSKSINREYPNLDLALFEDVIIKLSTGYYEFDQKTGIRSIMIAIKRATPVDYTEMNDFYKTQEQLFGGNANTRPNGKI